MDIGGEGGAAFPFDHVGDSVTGKITKMDEVQQTDMDTGAPSVWPDGRPKMMYRVVLATTLRESDDDDGERSVYLRGSRKPESASSLYAVLAAVKATTGGSSLDVGAQLTLTYTGDGVASQRGWNPPKRYSATYRPGSTDLAPPAQQPPAQQQAPAPAQNPAPAADPGVVGILNGNPITATQRAAMEAAGVQPASLPGWVGLG